MWITCGYSVICVLPHSWTHPLDTWLQVCGGEGSVGKVWMHTVWEKESNDGGGGVACQYMGRHCA